ncbi:MAG: hypothetical protein AAF089_11940 [Bacteroidota bacterium]
MFDAERSAYPHPDEFKVMRPEYTDLDPENEDEEAKEWQAAIVIAPFRVVGRSVTKAGARRAALYEAAKTYRSYHPHFRIKSPYPETFTGDDGMKWERLRPALRSKYGDYTFTDEDGEEDYADIEQMLAWDVRLAETEEVED